MRFFQLHKLNVDERLNDQIQASRLVLQQLRWDLVSSGFAGRPRAQIFQDEARLLGCSFSEFLELPLAYVYCPIPIYCFNIPRTFHCVIAFIELIKQNMPNMLLCYFHYNFEKITVKIKLHSSKLALRIRTR